MGRVQAQHSAASVHGWICVVWHCRCRAICPREGNNLYHWVYNLCPLCVWCLWLLGPIAGELKIGMQQWKFNCATLFYKKNILIDRKLFLLLLFNSVLFQISKIFDDYAW